jgi:hypothetical protein
MKPFFTPFSVTLAAGAQREIDVSGKHIYVAENSITTDPELYLTNGSGGKLKVGMGTPRSLEGFRSFIVKNPSETEAMTLLLYVTDDEIKDNRMVLTGSDVLSLLLDQLRGTTAAGTGVGHHLEDSATSELVLAANAARRGGVIQASVDNAFNVFLCFTDVSTTAFCVLEPGKAFPIQNYRGPVWAFAELSEGQSADLFSGEW